MEVTYEACLSPISEVGFPSDPGDVASHEFGHIIGLRDAYTLSNPPTSVMNAMDTPVQAIDVEKVIKAYATKRDQTYG